MPQLLSMLFAPKTLTPPDEPPQPAAPAVAPAAAPASTTIVRVELVPNHDGWVKLVGDETKIRGAIARRNARLGASLLRCKSRDGLYAPRRAYLREVAAQEARRGGLKRGRGAVDSDGNESESDVPADVDDPTTGPGALRRGVWALVGEVRQLREAVERTARPGLTTHDDLRAFGQATGGAPPPRPAFVPSRPRAAVLPWSAADGASVVSVTLPRPAYGAEDDEDASSVVGNAEPA